MPNRKGSKTWLHPPDALLRGHILYTVKFLGECTVEHPKGTEIVREAIRKMKFNKHIKRSEGQKPPKVDLTVSAEAVKIADPKSRTILHQYPLHRISYCADDKSDKRMFTFIAKAATTEEHFCYVFDSEKCAEEITLTIGQAFDLAYKKFLETNHSDVDMRKQCLVLHKKVRTLQFENDELKKRLESLVQLKDRADVEEYMRNNQISDITTVGLAIRESSTDDETVYKGQNRSSVVGRRLENLDLNNDSQASPSKLQTNGRHPSIDTPTSPGAMPILSPPPVNSRQTRGARGSFSGSNSVSSPANVSSPVSVSSPANVPSPTTSNNPFYNAPAAQANSPTIDQFGMSAFNPADGGSEQDMWDMRAGFSRGLSFGADDFSLQDLDPLNQRL